MRASLSNYRQAPRKVRLIADLIRGETVSHAYRLLDHTPKRATAQVKKLLASAVANAQQEGKVAEDNLIIRSVRVDGGVTLKRYRPVSRGSAHPIRKRTSNVVIELEQRAPVKKHTSARTKRSAK